MRGKFQKTNRIGIIEDNDNLLSNYKDFFEQLDDYSLCFAYESLEQLQLEASKYQPNPPDLILLDIHLPGTSGLDGIGMIKHIFPKSTVVMLTAYSTSDKIIEAIEKGALGYIVKGGTLFDLKLQLDAYRYLQ